MKYRNVIVREGEIQTWEELIELLDDGWKLKDGTYPVFGTEETRIVQLQKDDVLDAGDEYVDLIKVGIDKMAVREAALAENMETDYMRLMNKGYKPTHETSTEAVMKKTFRVQKKDEHLKEAEQKVEEALNDVVEELSLLPPENKMGVFFELDREAKDEAFNEAEELDAAKKEPVYTYSREFLGCDSCVNDETCTDVIRQALYDSAIAAMVWQCDKFNSLWTTEERKAIKEGRLQWE